MDATQVSRPRSGSGRPPSRPRGGRPTTAPPTGPIGVTSTGAGAQARSRSTASRSTTSTSARATASRWSSCTGSAASGRTGSRTCPRLAQERRVLALDLPGFGLTPMPDERITISGYGRFVDAFCTALGLDQVALVGNSMGGYIAAEIAIQFPARVSRLVLVSAAGVSSADVLQAPILTAGRVAHRLTAYGSARERELAAPAARPPHDPGAGGAPPAPAQGRLRLRGLLQGRGQARLHRCAAGAASTTTSATACPTCTCPR